MLVLSRKVDQAIIVGEGIEIQINRIEGDTVKIGIQAPRDVPIYRKELHESIKASNAEAVLNDHQATHKLPRQPSGKVVE